jgi:uncharacterized RDD family membrane protein YckC
MKQRIEYLTAAIGQRIEYLISALILAAILVAIFAFWAALLIGLIRVCSEWPTVTSCTIVVALFAHFLKQLTD